MSDGRQCVSYVFGEGRYPCAFPAGSLLSIQVRDCESWLARMKRGSTESRGRIMFLGLFFWSDGRQRLVGSGARP